MSTTDSSSVSATSALRLRSRAMGRLCSRSLAACSLSTARRCSSFLASSARMTAARFSIACALRAGRLLRNAITSVVRLLAWSFSICKRLDSSSSNGSTPVNVRQEESQSPFEYGALE